jgi:GNAT superfamily N-acetyltransferase
MLEPAHAGHLPLLRALIREGAAGGCFDAELAGNSADAALFFANLRQALATGQFIVEDARGVLSRAAVCGYVYRPERTEPLTSPLGFGLFRAFGDFGFELWLTAIAPEWRGNGHGRKLLQALLATPAGRLAFIARVRPESRDCTAMERLLVAHGYANCRDTAATRWFMRGDAPECVRMRLLTAHPTPPGARTASRRHVPVAGGDSHPPPMPDVKPRGHPAGVA